MARRKQAWSGWGAPAMKRVAGWDFDHRLNGYITTAADRFSCDCGEEFATPSGYRKCGSCGRAWNSYVIGSDSHGKEAALEKVIVREIPVRKDVIVASKRRRAAPQQYPQMKPENVMVDSPQEQENLSSFVNKNLNTARNPYDPWQREMAHRGLQWNWGQGPRGGGYEGENGEFQPPSRPAPYTMNQLTYPGHERDQYIDFAESDHWKESSPYHGSTPYAKELAQWRASNPHPNPNSFKSDVDDLYDARRAENPNMAFSRKEKFHNYHKTLRDQGLKYQNIKVRGGSGGFVPPDAWNPGDDLTPYVMSNRRRRASRPRTAESDCTCWEGYERVPGTKPCAKGSCRKKEARRYVAWCRQVGRMPSTTGLRRFRTAVRMVRIAKGDGAPYQDREYSPGMWSGIHGHYYYPDRIPKIHDYDQFRKDNPDWFNEDGSPNPPPMEDSNPWSMSSRKIAPPMNMSPRSKYLAPDKHPRDDRINDLYRRLSEDEIKQHWPEIPREEWTGYPGAVRYPGSPYHEPRMYSGMWPSDPGAYKVHAPGWETGMAPEKPNPSAMPKKVKPRPMDPSSAQSGLMEARRRRADRHTLRRIDLQEQEPEPEQDTVSIEHFSSRRRRAELFDITEEGETSKGKGKKSNTPTMRKNPDTWTKHKQNGQFSKRWN